MEFWSALLGAVIGGVATFAASWWQTRKVFRHERTLASDERHAADLAESQRVAVRFLEAIERMRASWGQIRRFDPPLMWGMHEPRPADPDHPALEALAELRTLTGSQALYLPQVLHAKCIDLVALIEEYRDARVEQDDAWTDVHLGRAGTDTLSYMSYVQSSLNEFVRDGATSGWVEPPTLRRQDLEPWAAGTAPYHA